MVTVTDNDYAAVWSNYPVLGIIMVSCGEKEDLNYGEI